MGGQNLCELAFETVKLWQNKKGRIFFCHACQNNVFFKAGSWEKACKQIFIPSYFVTALRFQMQVHKVFDPPCIIFMSIFLVELENSLEHGLDWV